MGYSDYLFRRQYLIASVPCDVPEHWGYARFGDYHIYHHPDVELTIERSAGGGIQAALIGYMIDPDHPYRSDSGILQDMMERSASSDQACEYLDHIAGRFVLLYKTPSDDRVFHDACALRSVYYAERDGNIYMSSQPSVFRYAFPLKKGRRFAEYHQSDYRHHPEPWLPCGCVLYEDMNQLLPNHYLELSTLKQVRYWPRNELQGITLDEGVTETASLLKRLLEAAGRRFSLAMPLTSGRDSRLLLAAGKDMAQHIFFYTLQHNKLESWSSDIKIPLKIMRSLGYKHHIIDARAESSPAFSKVYHTAYMAHESWKNMAWAMMKTYPREKVSVKGNVSEICRCFYYKSGKGEQPVHPDQLIKKNKGWGDLPFVYDHLKRWLPGARKAAAQTGVNVWDLFYWEHRMGGWQAQYQMEWDLVQETYSPYNHRGLIERMLSVPSRYRSHPDYTLYNETSKFLWPEVMSQPLNPASTLRVRTRHRVIGVLDFLGLKETVKMYTAPRGAER